MKRYPLLTALALLATPAMATDVGVSITVGEPGFYGRIDIGDFPPPVLIYREPIIVRPVPTVIVEPLYLHVPPGHAKNWRRYCYRYEACGRPVYFVRDTWYNEVYVPHYRERRGGWRDDDDKHDRRDKHEKRDKHRGKGHDKD